MLRRPLFGLVLSAALVLSLLAVPAIASTAGRTVASSSDAEPVSTYGDTELIDALVSYGLLDQWLAASPVSAQASLLHVTGNSTYQANRRAFLDSLESWGERHAQFRAELDRMDNARENVATLRAVTMQVRRALALDDRLAEVSTTAAAIEDAAGLLAQVQSQSHQLGFSMDSATLALRHLEDVRAQVDEEMQALTSEEAEVSSKSSAATIARLTDLQHELDNVDELIARGDQQAGPAQAEINRLQAGAVAQMPGLHAARMSGSTDVDGLPIVTVDAYVRAAASVSDSCPVDWTLLAGIGRIESRHGTLDGASVQSSGRVTEKIYGPLLDGGATEREAEAEAALAEEEARREIEAAAEAERVAEEEAYEASVWGQLRREREAVKANESATDEKNSDKDPNSDGRSSNSTASDLPEPRESETDAAETAEPPSGPTAATHDPALWGEFLPPETDAERAKRQAAADDEATANGDEEDEEDEEDVPEFKGNGFAVIKDSDDGVLDGNSRWDRAIGPMQFIPETWSYWETDGNRDGVADPQNLYDAAASAARFLCHLSRTRGSSPWTFVLGYNSSDTYVRNVMSSAEALRGAQLPNVQALLSS